MAPTKATTIFIALNVLGTKLNMLDKLELKSLIDTMFTFYIKHTSQHHSSMALCQPQQIFRCKDGYPYPGKHVVAKGHTWISLS